MVDIAIATVAAHNVGLFTLIFQVHDGLFSVNALSHRNAFIYIV